MDGLVNNAGMGIVGPVDWVTIDDMKILFEVNFWGGVRVTKVMLPLLKKSRGRIVNVTSMIGQNLFFVILLNFISLNLLNFAKLNNALTKQIVIPISWWNFNNEEKQL